MEIRIKKIPGQPTILAKISYVLTGILISTFILAFSIEIFSTHGPWLGVLLCLILTYLGLAYTKKQSRARLVTFGILGMALLSTIVVAVFLITFAKAFES